MTRTSETEIAELELRANAERIARAAGIANHPWHGAQQRLSDAHAMNRKLDESDAADAFAKAVTQYRSLLDEESEFAAVNARAVEKYVQCFDGNAQLQRYTAFLSSMWGREWILDRRQRMGTELPPGFSQQDLDSMEAFKAADAARQTAALQLQSVHSQMAVLEQAHPVLSDLRETHSGAKGAAAAA